MKVRHYKDPVDGKWFLELISRSYRELTGLKAEHEKKGRKTWMNIFDHCENTWVLTVEMNKAA